MKSIRISPHPETRKQRARAMCRATKAFSAHRGCLALICPNSSRGPVFMRGRAAADRQHEATA